MEHRTDEAREGLAAASDEEAPDEGHEVAAESETATAAAEEDAGDEAEEGDGDEAEGTPPVEASVAATVDSGTTNGTAPSNGAEPVELYTDTDLEAFRGRWDSLLTGFVDDPRASAEQADTLIGELVDRISERRQQLHDALDREDDSCETESLRVAILRYRAIYNALVRK